MTTTVINIPHDLNRMPLQSRLRFWASAYRGSPSPNHHVIADLEEAATEIDLMQLREARFTQEWHIQRGPDLNRPNGVPR